MKILAYRGKSLISKAIQWQTRSPYSHVAIECSDGTVFEAWHIGGVTASKSFRSLHSPGTKVDVFSIEREFNEDRVRNFLRRQVGKKYDFRSVFRFVSRRSAQADDRWFCSELVLAAMMFLLRHIPPSHTSPRDVTMSPYLVLESQRMV